MQRAEVRVYQQLRESSLKNYLVLSVISSSLRTSCLIQQSRADLDELEVYGSESQSGSGTSSSLASYKFEVRDSLINIGPIKVMSLGMPAFLSVS